LERVWNCSKALWIARTEGQSTPSYKRAEEIGCEIDEIWDAILDGKTRSEHG
jgi:hypothetical protein